MLNYAHVWFGLAVLIYTKNVAALSCRPQLLSVKDKAYTAVMVVPTGVGASIGGYAGDALPSAKLLASVADVLITHPNVMNGAMLYWPVPNVLYVEGYALDEFAAGHLSLQPPGTRGNKIGLLLDRGIEEDLLQRHVQVADAFRATLGINVAAAVVTSSPIGVSTYLASSGASWGSVDNVDALLEAARELVHAGCDAIAVVTRFPEDEEDRLEDADSTESAEGVSYSVNTTADMFSAYRLGQGVDAIAGAEALISHVITKYLGVPCAHAPAFSPSELFPLTDPKACAEELGYTFLPCVLAYLHYAPRLLKRRNENGPETGVVSGAGCMSRHDKGGLDSEDVDCVVIPASCLGGMAALSFLSQEDTLVIAVEDNTTNMQATTKALGLLVEGVDRIQKNGIEAAGLVDGESRQELKASAANGFEKERNRGRAEVVTVRSYAEAAGVMAAHKAGIYLPSIGPKVPRLGVLRL